MPPRAWASPRSSSERLLGHFDARRAPHATTQPQAALATAGGGGGASSDMELPPGVEVQHCVLLVTAHPDDEAMFFAPTILRLIEEGLRVALLCLSTGGAQPGAVAGAGKRPACSPAQPTLCLVLCRQRRRPGQGPGAGALPCLQPAGGEPPPLLRLPLQHASPQPLLPPAAASLTPTDAVTSLAGGQAGRDGGG